MAPNELALKAAALLASSGRSPERCALEPLRVGGNNRVFRLNAGDDSFVLKSYFRDPADPRDRLSAEFAFLTHAWGIGLRSIPRPIAADHASGLALYEFIEGRVPTGAEIDQDRVNEAAQFFAHLNSRASRASATGLGNASEACFSTASHLRMVDARLAKLRAISIAGDADRAAAEFIHELFGRWADAKTRIVARSADMEAPIARRWWALSPSDFGFHNTLIRPSGQLCFLDFEYAGWDDPAKTIGDFFAHPGIAVPNLYRDRFISLAIEPFALAEALTERARLFEPVFRVKWCCIVLNEFLPDAARRRQFADPNADAEARKYRQLDKARILIAALSQLHE